MKTRIRRFVRLAMGLMILSTTVVLAPSSAAQDRAGDPRLVGAWSKPFWEGRRLAYDPPSLEKSKKFPTAVSAVVLPDGRLLYWNGVEGAEDSTVVFFDDNLQWTLRNSRARILDLRSGKPRWTIPTFERGTTAQAQDRPNAATHDLFCADQKLLWDGTILIAGGTEHRDYEAWGDDETRIFDPETDSFRSVSRMREPRWYPSLVTLADGRVLVTSGVRRLFLSPLNPEPSFSQVRLSEIYDPKREEWKDAGVNPLSLPLYPRLHLLPDGTVFYGGAAQAWNAFGETADQGTWGLQRLYDPATQSWRIAGHALYGVRNGASSTLLRLEPPYDEAKILIAGGTAGVAPSTWAATTLSEVVRWTAQGGIENEATPKAPVAGLAGDPTQLRNRRWFSTPLMLPTGEALLLNGGDMDDVVDPGSAAAVRAPELYDPQTGTWRELAPGNRDRVYHHSAVLLADGSVLVGGHMPFPAHGLRYGGPARNRNFRDSTFEIYKPPYLFRGRRPVLSSLMPAKNGTALRLGVAGNAKEISEVVLVRMTAVTHSMDADMRAVKLKHKATGDSVMARLPKGGDGRILPPGPYYVFAMRETPDGPVPSIAHTVLIQPAGKGRVVARSL